MKRLPFALTALCCATLAPPVARADVPADMPDLCGVVVGSSTYGFSGYGVYSLPSATRTTAEPLKLDAAFKAGNGVVKAGDRLFTATAQGSFIVTGMTFTLWDTTTWEKVKTDEDADTDFKANALACNPSSGMVLGCFGEGYDCYMRPFDINTFEVDEMEEKSVNTALCAMAYAADGTLYGLDADGVLYRYNPSSMFSPLVEIGETGLAKYEDGAAAAVIDPDGGKMYYVFTDNMEHSQLYRINLSTADAEKIYTVPDDMQIGCLWIADKAGPNPSDYINPPYAYDFSDPEMPAGYVNINNNGDYSKWTKADGYMVYDYSGVSAADDYIVLPAMYLQGGKAYAFSVDAKCDAGSVERVAVYAGTAPAVEALTDVVVAPVEVRNHADWQTYTGYYVPAADGVYHFAVKACSDAAQENLYVTRVKVSAPVDAGIPAAIRPMTAVAAEYGELQAIVTLLTPSTDIAGNQLASLDRIEIFRDGTPIETITAPGKGVQLSRTYTVDAAGTYTFRAVPYSASGAGPATEASCFVGLDRPMSTAFVSAIEGDNDGQVALSWAPVDRDVNGTRMRASQVSYNVYRTVGNTTMSVAEGLKITGYMDQAVEPGARQQFVSYSVEAVSAGGVSARTSSEQMIVGADYVLPFAESFAGGHTTYPFGIAAAGSSEAHWDIPTPEVLRNPLPQDGDGGLVRFVLAASGDTGTLTTGRISLAGATRPMLTFYYYTQWRDTNTGSIEVLVSTGGDFAPLRAFALGGDNEWVKGEVDLSAYIGRKVQIRFAVKPETPFTLMDNIRVADLHDRNLAAVSLGSPVKAVKGRALPFTVMLRNDGALPAAEYSVALLRDGTEVARATGETTIEPDATATVCLSDVIPPFAATQVEYAARVIIEGDGYEDDNVTPSLALTPAESPHPAPSGLHVVDLTDTEVTIGWTAPDLEGRIVAPVTDGAEDYRTFSIGLPGSAMPGDYVGDWTMVDSDGALSYGARAYPSYQALEYPNAGMQSAFQIFSPGEFENVEDIFAPRTGDKLWVCFDAKGSRTDDWMISPELDPRAQTVSFYARSARPDYGMESLEILRSSEGTDIAGFTSVSAVAAVPGEWTLYTADLPEGTRHFAIRCTSDDCYALLVDDVTMLTAEAAGTNLRVEGYRLYRDKLALADGEQTALSHTHAYDKDATVTYHVTALYNEGESAPSEAYVFDPSTAGITVAAGTVPVVTADGGTIVVSATAGAGVTVCSADGRIVYSADGDARIAVRPGVYIVRAGSTTVKVAVR